MAKQNKYCIKCGKPIEVCPECKGTGWYNCYDDSGESFYYRTECPTCNGTGTVHKCNPKDLEVKSFEERWLEGERGRIMEAKDMDRIADLLFKRKYTELIVTEQLRLDQAIDYIETQGYRAGIREVAEDLLNHLTVLFLIKARDGDTGGMDVCNHLKDRMQAKLKEWGIKYRKDDRE